MKIICNYYSPCKAINYTYIVRTYMFSQPSISRLSRFLMFCLHSNIGSLKKLATDTITNLADKVLMNFAFTITRNTCMQHVLLTPCILNPLLDDPRAVGNAELSIVFLHD